MQLKGFIRSLEYNFDIMKNIKLKVVKMSANEIIEQAIDLKPQDRYLVIEQLILSLNEPDKDIENLWIEESDRRLKEYKKGSLKTASFDEVFSK